MTEFQPGDKVRHEGVVSSVGQGYVTFEAPGGHVYAYPVESLTLIEPPMPPLPTAFGSRIIATVRGVEDVPLVHVNYSLGGLHDWVSETRVAHCNWHPDSDITAWRPWVDDVMPLQDDFDSGLTDAEAARVMMSIRTGEPAEPSPVRRVRRPWVDGTHEPCLDDACDECSGPQPEPVCKCGHGADEHNAGQFGCLTHRDECQCVVYRPAIPQPEPTGLVERAASAIADNGHPSTIEDWAADAIRVVADWLDEQGGPTHVAAGLIRREVGGSDE